MVTDSKLMDQHKDPEAQSLKGNEKEVLCVSAPLCLNNSDSIESDSERGQGGVK